MKVLVLNPPSKYDETVSRDLIYGCWCHGNRVANIQLPPLNLLYIATILKNEGQDVSVLDALAERKKIDEIKELGKNFDCIIVSSSNTTFGYDVYTVKQFKEINPKLIAIFCGPQSTVYPKEILNNDVIDYNVYGEYETTIKELVERLNKKEDVEKIKGISYRKDGRVIITPPREFIENLDDLPIPDRSFIKKEIYFNPLAKKKPITTALTSRGCIGRCIFCTSPSFYGKKYRLRSSENVLDELMYLYKEGYKDLLFRDEIFTADRKRLERICNGMIDKKIKLKWACNARVGTLNEETMKLMKRAGCYSIWFGVESGSQTILNNIKKDIKIETIERDFVLTKKVGIGTHAHLMFGCLGESKETIKQTIKFIKKIKPDTIDIGIMTPFPGTELYELVKEKTDKIGDGTQFDIGEVHTRSFFNEYFCDLNAKELEDAITEAYKEFYFRPSYILKRIFKIRNFQDFKTNFKSGLYTLSFIIKNK